MHTINIVFYRWLKKDSEHLHALCSGTIKINQQESTCVVGKHFQICLGIFA